MRPTSALSSKFTIYEVRLIEGSTERIVLLGNEKRRVIISLQDVVDDVLRLIECIGFNLVESVSELESDPSDAHLFANEKCLHSKHRGIVNFIAHRTAES